jgi:thymidylate synthase ThyX
MLQALYSRSPQSVVSQLEKVKAAGSGKFMAQFYVGYGHASIGDCGSTTIFIEGASMLVAKAIQNHALYSGQEASTRYLDFATQPQIDPYQRPESTAILARWIEIYNANMPKVKAALSARHPFSVAEHKTEKAWEKAIAARAFDILRCLLPVGTGTLLSWHTNLRQARDHLRRLKFHPLAEVREVAGRIYASIHAKYPHSFNDDDMNPASERLAARNAFGEKWGEADHVLRPSGAALAYSEVKADMSLYNVDLANAREGACMNDRPQGAPVPHRWQQYGVMNLSFLLDFGSYRDLQRHRNGYCPIPLVSNQFGFYQWYKDELQSLLSATDYAELMAECEAQFAAIKALPFARNDLNDQYLYPMGMAVECQLTYSLPQMIYVAELRSGATVHPSLRPIAIEMGRILQRAHPQLKLYLDESSDSWSFKRGQQDIVEKVG